MINLQGEESPTEQGLTLAHEIGHGFGLPHTFEDAGYPRPEGALGPFVGLRTSPSISLVPGTTATGATSAYDLMSYSSPSWFSPHNYCRALTNATGGAVSCPNVLVG